MYKRQEAWSPLARGKVFENEALKKIAENHGKSVSQISLRWIVQHGVVPIPKSTTEERILDNISIFDFELNSDEMKTINEPVSYTHLDVYKRQS